MKTFIIKYTVLALMTYFGLLYMGYQIPVGSIITNGVEYVQSGELQNDIEDTKTKIETVRVEIEENKEVLNDTVETVNKIVGNIDDLVEDLK